MPRYTFASKSIIRLSEWVVSHLQDLRIGPDDMATLASIAAQTAGEKAVQLNPLCDPQPVIDVDTQISFDGPVVTIQVTVEALGDKMPKIEAMLAGASAAVLVWDMAFSVAKRNNVPYSQFSFECAGIDVKEGQCALEVSSEAL